jgi:hypothetical protein
MYKKKFQLRNPYAFEFTKNCANLGVFALSHFEFLTLFPIYRQVFHGTVVQQLFKQQEVDAYRFSKVFHGKP